MDIVDKALADMREGRKVLVVSADEPGIARLFDLFAEGAEAGERVYRAAHRQRIERGAGGRITFATYGGARTLRGIDLDSVYLDHSRVREALMPNLCTSAEPRLQHY